MPKSGAVRPAPADDEQSRQLGNAIEGRIAEICRELAVEAKRIHQLQEQADELRTVVRQWVGQMESRTRPGAD